ncbi:MAG: PEP-CTERM sorting domain-containing protein [Chthonomonadaceae bacterium]|nr:PEP-CTERM sorting domain-containing protein [Chthonomonadaceae bacterium]
MAASFAAAAFSQIAPPSWWNVDDGNTTSHGWTFDDENDPFFDSVGLNPWGDPEPNIVGNVNHDDNTGEMVIGPATSGESSFGFTIRNHERQNWVKEFWWQMVVRIEGSSWFTYVSYPIGTNLDYWTTTEFTDLGNGYYRYTAVGQFSPQPEWEGFGLGVDEGTGTTLTVDSMYFGTHCTPVPEPMTMTLAGLALAGAARRRMRKGA